MDIWCGGVYSLLDICSGCIIAELGLLENPQHSLQYLEEVERLGEEIVRDKQEVVALDRRRNQNREALRALQHHDCGKTWLTLGSLLIKTPANKAKELLEHGKSPLSLLSWNTNHAKGQGLHKSECCLEDRTDSVSIQSMINHMEWNSEVYFMVLYLETEKSYETAVPNARAVRHVWTLDLHSVCLQQVWPYMIIFIKTIYFI